jgi:hypothetical protein
MNEWLAASDGGDWSAAFFNCVDTLLNGKSPRQDIVGMLYLTTTGTGKVTLIERF